MYATTRFCSVVALAGAAALMILGLACGTKQNPPTTNDNRPDQETLGDTIVDEPDAPGNLPPVADAGPNHLAAPGDRVRLDGAASFDPDDDPLTFEWTFVGGAEIDLEDADTSVASFIVPDTMEDGDSLSFTLAVSDGRSRVVDNVVVTISLTRACEFVANLDGEEDSDSPIEAHRPVAVQFDAALLSGDISDDAEFVWIIDGEELREPVEEHEGLNRSFSKAGLHTVLLTVAMGELNVACVNLKTGVQSESVYVRPVISGRALDAEGEPIPGVTVSTGAGGTTAVTSATGSYAVNVPYNWTGTLKAQHVDHEFSPAEYRFSQVSGDKERDFQAGAGDGDDDGDPIGCEVDEDCADELFCNGEELCIDGLCKAGENPCPGQLCDELADECYVTQQSVDCEVDAECDDGSDCTDDSCQDGVCVSIPNDANCDDGLFCNGSERCLGGACVPGDPPCPGECDESADSCGLPIACDDDTDCNDGIDCTTEHCENNTCKYILDDAACDDGLFCNGPESCKLEIGCQSSGSPCGVGQSCNENDDACEDAPDCTDDGDCDDDVFCNGQETCDNGTCTPGADPCEPGETCNEETDSCDPPQACSNDQDCDDGVVCTVDTCDTDAGTCVFTPDNSVCNDGLFCNGPETCNPAGGDPETGCKPGNDPCPGEECNENTDDCAECLNNADCNDGNPCTNDSCSSGSCQYANNSNSCDDNNDCTENDTCSGGECTGDPIEGCESGTSYYVDGATGNDSNPGTLQAPFKTIQRAANVVGPGDTVYIRAGTYTELDITFGRSGRSDAPITISGFPGEEHAVILQTTASPPGGRAVFSLLDITGQTPGFGHYVFRNFTLRNAGFSFWLGSRTARPHDLLFDNLTFYDSETALKTEWLGVERLVVRHCIAHDMASGEGAFNFKVNSEQLSIPGSGSRGLVFLDNSIYNNTHVRASGIIIQEQCRSSILIGNTSYNNGQYSYTSKAGGYHIWLNNKAYNNGKGGFYLSGPFKDYGGGEFIHAEPANYILVNNVAVGRKQVESGTIINWWRPANVWLYNNTSISLNTTPGAATNTSLSSSPGMLDYVYGYSTRGYSKNNVFVHAYGKNVHWYELVYEQPGILPRTYFGDYNLHHSVGSSENDILYKIFAKRAESGEVLINVNATLRQWREWFLDNQGDAVDANSLWVDPAFVDFDGSDDAREQDLRLDPGAPSPAINAGQPYGSGSEDFPTKIAAFLAEWNYLSEFGGGILSDSEKASLVARIRSAHEYDIDGNPRDSAPDMGAYESP